MDFIDLIISLNDHIGLLDKSVCEALSSTVIKCNLLWNIKDQNLNVLFYLVKKSQLCQSRMQNGVFLMKEYKKYMFGQNSCVSLYNHKWWDLSSPQQLSVSKNEEQCKPV